MIISFEKANINGIRTTNQRDPLMARKILIVDSSDISKKQVRNLLESADYIVYHTNSIHNIRNYLKELQIDLIIIHQSLLLKESDAFDRIEEINTPMLILASIFYDNLKVDVNQLRNVRVLRLPKSDKVILSEINTMINTYNGKYNNRHAN